MADSKPSTRVKPAALSLLSLGLVLTVAGPTLFEAVAYIGLITVVMASLSVFLGITLWMGGGFEARVFAIVIGLAGALGQAVNSAVGLPGASALKGETGTLFWLALGFELLTIFLITADSFRKRQI